MPRAAKAKALLTVFLLTGTVLFLVFGVGAMSSGITRELASQQTVDFGAEGCSCHGKEGPYADVNVSVQGLPPVFEAGKKYSVWVNFSGGPAMPSGADANKGGLNVLVSSGKLSPAEAAPQKDYTQSLGIPGRELTHTKTGDQHADRHFNFVWDSTGAGNSVTMVVTVQAVNGDNVNNGADEWNRVIVSSALKGKAPESVIGAASEGHTAVHKLGIHSLAYWVGVISFAVLFIIYGATFFLFKYGESSATTDHHDRPGAAEEAVTLAPVRQRNLMILGLVALLAIILVVVLLRQRGLLGA